MGDALPTLHLPIAAERRLEDAASNQDIREDGETAPGDLRISLLVQAIQSFDLTGR